METRARDQRQTNGRWIKRLCGVVALVGLGGGTWAQEPIGGTVLAKAIKELDQRTELVLGTADNFAPYAYRDTRGEWAGIDVEIARHLFPGLKVKVAGFPRVRLEMMTRLGEIDGLLSTSSYVGDDLAPYLVLSSPVYESEVSAFCLKVRMIDKPSAIFDASQGFRLGALSGTNYRLGGYDIDGHARVIRVQRDQQLLDLLRFGRIDIAVSEDISFMYRAHLTQQFELVKPLIEISSRPVSIALNKLIVEKEPQLLERLNQAISRSVKDESIDKIILSYLSDLESKPVPAE